jgi:hypothetical protein
LQKIENILEGFISVAEKMNIKIVSSPWVYGWVGGWVGGWMDGCKSCNDCLQLLKTYPYLDLDLRLLDSQDSALTNSFTLPQRVLLFIQLDIKNYSKNLFN